MNGNESTSIKEKALRVLILRNLPLQSMVFSVFILLIQYTFNATKISCTAYIV